MPELDNTSVAVGFLAGSLSPIVGVWLADVIYFKWWLPWQARKAGWDENGRPLKETGT